MATGPGREAGASKARHDDAATRREGDSAAPRLRRAALQEWEALIGKLKLGKPALAAVLEYGVPRAVSEERIIIAFKKGSFYGRQAEARASKEAIQAVAREHFGCEPRIEIRYDAESGQEAKTVAAVEADRQRARSVQRRKEALDHPAVQDAMQVFPESRGHVDVRLEGD